MDLFNVAENNGPNIVARLRVVADAFPGGERASLERFTDHVRDAGRISINMRPSVMLSFLVSSKHQNIYEWAASRAAHSTKTAPEIVREQLGGHYEKRMAFDGFFTDGHKLRYGALNIGGAGASHYGTYCCIVSGAAPHQKLPVAYLRADSLKTYMLPGPAVDGPAIEQDATPHPHRHCLATIKHARDVVGTADTDWAALLCNNDDFVEAIFSGELTAGDIECVRMPKTDHEALYEFAFEDFRTKLGEADKIEMGNFVMIIDELAKRAIRLEVV